MNKQELIKKYEEIYKVHSPFNETVCYAMMVYSFVEELKKLDEPEKVQIPQFVADWIEVCKEHLTTSLYTAMNPNFMKENNQSFDLILWIKKTSNQETFARAWLDGYEVEKEKRYKIKIKASGQYFLRDQDEDVIVIGNPRIASKLTKEQLEQADFGWVFDCPGVEVTEVE